MGGQELLRLGGIKFGGVKQVEGGQELLRFGGINVGGFKQVEGGQELLRFGGINVRFGLSKLREDKNC